MVNGQELNIPGGYNIPGGSPYSDSQSPYNMSQPSPDSNGLAAMAITGSPQTQPPNVSDSDIVNILGLGAEESDSASQLIPRQMERQQSGLHTPNISSNLSEIL